MQGRQGYSVISLNQRLLRTSAASARQLSATFFMPSLVRHEKRMGLPPGTLSGAHRLVASLRGRELLLYAVAEDEALALASGSPAKDIKRAVLDGDVDKLFIVVRCDGGLKPLDASALLPLLKRWPGSEWLVTALSKRPASNGASSSALETIKLVKDNIALVDFLGAGYLPFNAPEHMPGYVSAEPRRRSALLLNNAYYYFEVLASALRKRGWDVLTASFEPPDSPSRRLYWNQETIVYDPDPAENRRKAAEFFKSVVERYGAVQLYGQFQMSVFRDNWSYGSDRTVPWDFLEMRRRGIVIGYTPSGCLDGARQSSIRRASSGMCGRCVWENEPAVCSDELNGRWASQLDLMCDWVGLENDYAVDERTGPKYVRRPVVSGLDPEIWSPEIEVPAEHRIQRQPGDVLVYHAFANSMTRRKDGKDVKGSGPVIAAIDRLREEGFAVKLFYATDIPTRQVRFYQVQADIVVDQLHYGRTGSNARESLMLGRPLVTRVEPAQEGRTALLDTMTQLPAANADATSIYDVLRRLIQAPEERADMGRRSREYALRWHSADVCAARYEKIVDRVREGLPVDIDEHPLP